MRESLSQVVSKGPLWPWTCSRSWAALSWTSNGSCCRRVSASGCPWHVLIRHQPISPRKGQAVLHRSRGHHCESAVVRRVSAYRSHPATAPDPDTSKSFRHNRVGEPQPTWGVCSCFRTTPSSTGCSTVSCRAQLPGTAARSKGFGTQRRTNDMVGQVDQGPSPIT